MMRLPRHKRQPAVDVGCFTRVIETSGFTLDDAQLIAVSALTTPGVDVYLHGPPGRGKTWLLDILAQSSSGRHLRLHVHEFVRGLHEAITSSGSLNAALTTMLDGVTLLCFDELVVDDPADGIYVDALLRAALRRGTRVVITSNSAPGDLMPNPLFHHSFLSTIALVEKHCRVITLDGGPDHREATIHGSGFASGRWLSADGTRYHPQRPSSRRILYPTGHAITALAVGPGEVCFEFDSLCRTATGTSDYLSLAEQFGRWTLVGVPRLDTVDREACRRFAHVIDVLYDRDIPTTFLADADIATCVPADLPLDGLARLLSRLSTLQSPNRFAEPVRE